MTIRSATATVLLAILAATTTPAAQPTRAPAPTPCDRDCLKLHVTQLLTAFVKHDVSTLPVAPNLRVTEDAVEKPLKSVGLVTSITGLRGYRQDIIDERAQVAGAHVMVEEGSAPVMLVVRVKVVADKLTEIELVATHDAKEGLIFNLNGLQATTTATNIVPLPNQLATRDDAIRIAMKYPEGLASAKSFAAVNAPFAAEAGCANIAEQSLAIFERLGDPQTRMTTRRMAWGA